MNLTVQTIENVRISTLARVYGTPLYVYSQRAMVENFRSIERALAPLRPTIAFAVKSNSNGAILRTLIGEGAGLDIVSVGELRRGLAAGADPDKIIFAGVGKRRDEIAEALRAGIRMINLESEAEAEAVDAAARELGVTATVALRVNPDVDPATHRYITTGKRENKFGVAFKRARRVFGRIARLRGLRPIGLHAHIGSQITDPQVYVRSLDRIIELSQVLRNDGHSIQTINLGGGFGIDYARGRRPLDVAKLARALEPRARQLDVDWIFEPGRFIVGPAGFLLTRVEHVKTGPGGSFVIVDAGMNDLLRPSLYGAHHRIAQVGPARAERRRRYDVVGPICESGDFLGKNRLLSSPRAGDMLWVYDCGAYGMTMASNYNSRPRPAEVMVKGTRHGLIRERESIEDLVRHERLPDFLQ